jgi:dihydropyrimidine dehydrogenase (NAD+) subunit PreA
MVAEIARDPQTKGLPISGIGGISTWRDAAEFMVLGSRSVQVCTAAMHYGFKIVDDMIDGLNNWMDEKGYRRLDDFVGKAVPNVTDWQHLNINFESVARINQDACIKCGLCYIACEDTSHQAIRKSVSAPKARSTSYSAAVPFKKYEVIQENCVGCNLCALACPVTDCITMEKVENGKPFLTWKEDPRNPRAVK